MGSSKGGDGAEGMGGCDGGCQEGAEEQADLEGRARKVAGRGMKLS